MEPLSYALLFLLLVTGSVQVSGERTVRNVASILNAPFLMLREAESEAGNEAGSESENERYEGFIVDLLEHVSRVTGEDYSIYLSPDNKYGARLRNGSWNGLMGEVISKRADLAAAALSVSYLRSNVVDFGPAFMNTGVQLLYKKPAHSTANMLTPFSTEVWLCIVAGFLMAGLGLYLLRRFTQQQEENDTRSALAKCADAYWSLIKALSLQGLPENALTMSVRVLLVSWLMFCALTLALFFASLTAWYPAIIHGVREEEVPFTDSKSLLAAGLTFGCVNAGSTKAFFRISSGNVYEKMFYRMESERSYVRSVADGLERAREGNFVFIGESLMLEYAASHEPCDVQVVGEHMSSNAYALATPQGSQLKDKLDSAIMQLKENGVVQQLKSKWWKSQCTPDNQHRMMEAIKAPEKVLLWRYLAAGPVIILCVGMLAAAGISATQTLWQKRKSKPGAAETTESAAASQEESPEKTAES